MTASRRPAAIQKNWPTGRNGSKQEVGSAVSNAILAFLSYNKSAVISHTPQQETQMIIVFTTFTLPKPITREEARSIFLSTAPKYRGVQGLVRKHYVLSDDGVTAGGVYLWNSRPEAEAMYTESWRSFVREKDGNGTK